MRLIICLCISFLIIHSAIAQYIFRGSPSQDIIEYELEGDMESYIYGSPNSRRIRVLTPNLAAKISLDYVELTKVDKVADNMVILINRSFGLHWTINSIEMITVKPDDLEIVNAYKVNDDGTVVDGAEVNASAMTVWQDSLALIQNAETLDFVVMNNNGDLSDPIPSTFHYYFLDEIDSQLIGQTNNAIHLLSDDLSISETMNFSEELLFTKVINDRIFVVLASRIIEFNSNLQSIEEYYTSSNSTVTDLTLSDESLRIIEHDNNDKYHMEISDYIDGEWSTFTSFNNMSIYYHSFIDGSNGRRIYGEHEIMTYPNNMVTSALTGEVKDLNDVSPDIALELMEVKEYVDTLMEHVVAGDTIYELKHKYDINYRITNMSDDTIYSFDIFSNRADAAYVGYNFSKHYFDLNILPDESVTFSEHIDRSVHFDNFCLYIQACNGKVDLVAENNHSCLEPQQYTSTKDLVDVDLVISPNPVLDKLYFSSDATLTPMAILDFNGGVILNWSTSQNYCDVSDLNAGIFLVVFQNKQGGIVYKRFVKS